MKIGVNARLQKVADISVIGKRISRGVAFAVVLSTVVGCASQGVPVAGSKFDRVRVAPCTPLRADDLMDWATELDGSVTHERSARVSVDAQGWARCSSSERASSRTRAQ